MEHRILEHELRISKIELQLNTLHEDFKELEVNNEKIVEILSIIQTDIAGFKVIFKTVCSLVGVFFSLASLYLGYLALK